MSASWLAIANGANSSSGSCRVWRWNCCGIRKSVPIAAAVFCRPSSFSAVQRRNTLKQDTSPFVCICLQTCLQFLCQFRQLMMHYLQQPADVAFLVKPHVTYQLHYFLSYISIGQNSFVQNPIEFFSPAPLLFVLVSQWQLPFLNGRNMQPDEAHTTTNYVPYPSHIFRWLQMALRSASRRRCTTLRLWAPQCRCVPKR